MIEPQFIFTIKWFPEKPLIRNISDLCPISLNNHSGTDMSSKLTLIDRLMQEEEKEREN